jgi:hypothetical protein
LCRLEQIAHHRVMNIDDLLNQLMSRPFSDEKATQLAEALDWYLRQNPCDDTFRITLDVASQIFLNGPDAVAWLRNEGAACDCQALDRLSGMLE